MSKVKYYYDSDTLAYRKIELKKGRKIGLILLYVLGMFLSGFLLLLVYLNIPAIETPREKIAKRELANLELRFELLNRKMSDIEEVLANVEDRDNNIYRLYFEANPVPEEQRKAGFGGINRYRDLEGFDNSKLIISTSKRMDILTKRLVVQSKSLDEITVLAKEKEKLLASIPAIQPVANEDLSRMASGYGFRTDPFTKARKFHYGMDFTSPRGTPIYATGDGKVVRADNTATGYGNHIVIDHGFGYETLYAHLHKYNVRNGQKVNRGDIIGFVGSTGRSQAPHLHYEVFKDGERLNPINFYYGHLTAEEFDTLLKKSQQENQSLD
ncbi:MAG: peptidase M23 [Flavobacteriaceae bacterium CG_4_8_14_3_um_filter_34_10]|nr:M23 family metallopeptidase [Flavobacteriia bacterium]OIP51459.1 MAG: peptidase M23 [Flavobacteriaceae bacterium CG2_30_34_30]PIQ17503.1 MAG: peptidase M23 [Flavobacteriaceae bacterium CG18_big_fil_WC_8_21_14_2_50_34_36]PIV50310.1 MAG: peptidase M23 [Flavobacteriaceae bacterium CG02_land_8_20_14_3_00_34_13]PIX08154.1 MAG: peptidase M23 [Flavobacteriaceae bacterium CG_4_8_14_3_um_filter_34_10]PIZ08416.1 MAG: peptidase M23 [Flavobacteriaceae bacterium CG_4_10_14_0_8_um_filter_34_31]PJC06715.